MVSPGALMSGMVNCCGALAAESRGTVNISSVRIAGSIEGKENIGAFVGKVSGELVTSNCGVSGSDGRVLPPNTQLPRL